MGASKETGGEFTRKAFRQYCRELGAKLEFAATNTPEWVGANELAVRTLASMVRCLLADSGLPHFLWRELFLTAPYLCNRASYSAHNHATPYTALHGKYADLGHLRVIEARAFVHVETHTTKVDPCALEGRVVGFGQDSLAYRLYHTGWQTVRESRNVIFIETSFVPAPDFETASDKGTFAHEDLDDMVRDVHNFSTRLDLGSPSDSRTSEDVSMLHLLEQLSDVTNRDLRDSLAQPSSPGSSPIEESPPSGTSPGGEPLPSGTPLDDGTPSLGAPPSSGDDISPAASEETPARDGVPARGRSSGSSSRGRASGSTPPATRQVTASARCQASGPSTCGSSRSNPPAHSRGPAAVPTGRNIRKLISLAKLQRGVGQREKHNGFVEYAYAAIYIYTKYTLPAHSSPAAHPRGPSKFSTTTTKPCDCRKRTCGK